MRHHSSRSPLLTWRRKEIARRDKTNVYGPRPRDAYFRCWKCGSFDYPLFGFIPSRGEETPADTACEPCLWNTKIRGRKPVVTQDARRALDIAKSMFHRHGTIESDKGG